jgi:hypothetical protein
VVSQANKLFAPAHVRLINLRQQRKDDINELRESSCVGKR